MIVSTRTVRRATINDVARAAAVSRQTVSNALNRPERVRPETLERVRVEVERLGYRPSQAAQGMRSQRSGAVGVEINAVSRDASDIAQLYLTELTVAAPRYDVHLVPFAHGSVFPALAGYQEMTRRRLVDAFVLADTHPGDPRPEWLTAQGMPFAAFGRVYGHPEITSWADVDSRVGTGEAVHHLVGGGYSTIAFLGWPQSQDASVLADERREGWASTADQLDVRGPEATAEQDLASAVAAAQGLVAQLAPGDAVVCASDLLALGVLYAASARGLRVGPDLGVVGFDGSLTASRHGLTSVAQPLDDLADTLLGILHDQLTGGSPATSGQLLTPTLSPGPSTDRTGSGSAYHPLPVPGDRR